MLLLKFTSRCHYPVCNKQEPIRILMKILVTGSSGHLGEALVRALSKLGHDTVGIDIIPSATTILSGSITDRLFVKQAMKGVEIVFHTATLHKPHVATHDRQLFIDTNITGTLNLLEEAVRENVRSFIYTSTTSTFGDALVPGQVSLQHGSTKKCSRFLKIFTELLKPRLKIYVIVLPKRKTSLHCFENIAILS